VQRGGVVRAQVGRLIPTMLEPGELVYPGPLMPTQIQHFEAVNRMFPRFQVGGVGEGDSVPAMLPEHSFVLNRRATTALRRGYQEGGMVSSGGGDQIHIHLGGIHFNGNINSELDIDALLQRAGQRITKEVIQRMRDMTWRRGP
jgi:hypothetical protein